MNVIFSFFTVFCLIPVTATAEETKMWNHWYTVTINKKIPYAYYNEKVMVKDARIHLENHLWKKEEGFINEEHLGVFAKANAELTPLFYNFYSRYRKFETRIDGSIDDGKRLRVVVTRGGKREPPIKIAIRKKTFFSSMFPIWLGIKLKKYTVGTEGNILTIPEDDLERHFQPTAGRVQFSPKDEFAKKSKSHRFDVRYANRPSTWWIDDLGATVRAELQAGTTVIERTTEEKAKAFLSQ